MTSTQKNVLRQRWSFIAIICLAFFLRLANLEQLPLFYDEIMLLQRARNTADGWNLGIALELFKVLHIWIVAAFYHLSPSPIWVGRFVSALFGVLTVCAAYILAMQLFTKRSIAVLAALFYAILPLATFHERLAQNDGILSFFITLFVFFSLRTIKRDFDSLSVLWMILSFGLALLTKYYAILFLSTPFLAYLLFKQKPLGKKAWALSGAVLLGLGIMIALVTAFLSDDSIIALFSKITILQWDIWLPQFRKNLIELVEWLYTYFLWPTWLIIGLGIIFNRAFHSRSNLFLFFTAFIPIIFFVLFARRWFPRYLVPSAVPIIIILAQQVYAFLNKIKDIYETRLETGSPLMTKFTGSSNFQRNLWRSTSLRFLLIGSLIVPMFGFNVSLITNPLETNLSREDRRQYFEGMPAGYGLSDAASYLHQLSKQHGTIYVWRNRRSVMARYGLRYYLANDENIKRKIFGHIDQNWAEIEHKFNETAVQAPSYVVLNLPWEKGVPGLDEIDQLSVEKLFFKPGGQGHIGVYRWLSPLENTLLKSNLMPNAGIGLSPELAKDPLLSLKQEVTIQSVAPTNTITNLAQTLPETIHYIAFDKTTLQNYQLLDANERLLYLPTGWSLEANIQNCAVCLFRVWPQTSSSLVQFGTQIELIQTQISETVWEANPEALVTLYWRSELDALDSDLAVFLQVLDQQGQLVAQNDQTWLLAGFPARVHRQNDILSQHFTLDMSQIQGDVCLYTGTYDRSSGQRLEASLGSEKLLNNAYQIRCGFVGP